MLSMGCTCLRPLLENFRCRGWNPSTEGLDFSIKNELNDLLFSSLIEYRCTGYMLFECEAASQWNLKCALRCR